MLLLLSIQGCVFEGSSGDRSGPYRPTCSPHCLPQLFFSIQ